MGGTYNRPGPEQTSRVLHAIIEDGLCTHTANTTPHYCRHAVLVGRQYHRVIYCTTQQHPSSTTMTGSGTGSTTGSVAHIRTEWYRTTFVFMLPTPKQPVRGHVRSLPMSSGVSSITWPSIQASAMIESASPAPRDKRRVTACGLPSTAGFVGFAVWSHLVYMPVRQRPTNGDKRATNGGYTHIDDQRRT